MDAEMEMIRELALKHAKDTVQAMAIAQRMGMMNSEEELVNLLAAGIETALEEFELIFKKNSHDE
jgi:hypothetical protein